MISLSVASDFLRDGIFKSIVGVYTNAFGVGSEYIFYMFLVGVPMILAYIKTEDSFFPLLILLVSGGSLVGVMGAGMPIAWLMILTSIIGIFWKAKRMLNRSS